MQTSSSEKPQPPDPPDHDPPNEEKKPTKKKRVSFKFGLETSDDSHIVKKEPNASLTPTASIIKKECLTRAIRIARGGESIIMPSRLTGLTGLNNIDKLNSLTFKSQKPSNADKTKRANDESDEEEPPADDSEKEPKSTSDSDHSDDEKSAKNDECGDKESASMTKAADADGNGADDNGDTNEESSGKNSHEKKFILPKRSAHSSRVIKPNKKFIDESQAATSAAKKKDAGGKKKTTKVETNDGARSDASAASKTTDGAKSESKECKPKSVRIRTGAKFDHFLFSLRSSRQRRPGDEVLRPHQEQPVRENDRERSVRHVVQLISPAVPAAVHRADPEA